ncbi:protein translocase subunit [Coemansia javaensis]|uniref:Mitochondrial import inner membrane translocase subunit n=1 Tax=Coemansia javaensis TaxID=2761396 RepID=A0A9W8LJI4_9FUNG|nr:protein translocase subunit [Coemansia javaensis]
MSSGFGGAGLDLGGGSNIESMSKDEIIHQIRSQAALAGAQELISSISKHCFKMCVPAPGPSLGSSDEGCLGRCIDKYLAAWDAVSRTYVAHVQKQQP